MAEPPKVKGHFIINVAEASGKNKEDQLVWDPNFVEGFVKGMIDGLLRIEIMELQARLVFRSLSLVQCVAVEIRGGAKNVKVLFIRTCQTSIALLQLIASIFCWLFL